MKCVYCSAEWKEPLCPACRHGLEAYYAGRPAYEGARVKLQRAKKPDMRNAAIVAALVKLQRAKKPDMRNAAIVAALVIDEVANESLLRAADIISPRRTLKLATPRHAAMWLIYKYTILTFDEIGSYFGGRDHSTILHACKKVEAHKTPQACAAWRIAQAVEAKLFPVKEEKRELV